MSVALAFIPLAAGAKLSSTAIRTRIAEDWPDLPTPERAESKKEVMSIDIGGEVVMIALMRAPIPWSDLEGPCETSWLWKDAAKELRKHTSHLIVTILSKSDPIEQSKLLTQVCSSILAVCEQAPGIYWSNATLLVPSKLFQEFAQTFLPTGLPVLIWVDVRAGKRDNGKTAGFTSGMSALGHMELETETSTESPGELRQRFLSLAEYLLENGPVIKDGDTIGEDANERIRVVYSKSAFGHKEKVMRLEYGSAKSRKGWFGR